MLELVPIYEGVGLRLTGQWSQLRSITSRTSFFQTGNDWSNCFTFYAELHLLLLY